MSKILIALDDGHGMKTAGKRTPPIAELNGRVIHENEFNREVVKLVDIELKRNGFETLLTAPTDEDVSLSARTNLANSKKVNLLISFHFNAITGKFETSKAEGFSVHVHSKIGESAKIGNIVLKHLTQGTKQKNRGLVVQNLHITRETKMPAILIEFGFMDNKREAMLMIDKGFQKECAVEVAKAVCEYYKVNYNNEIIPSTPSPVSKDNTRGIGLVEVKTDGLSLRNTPSLSGRLERRLGKGEKYFAYEKSGMWYNLGANLWASEGSAKNHLVFTPHPKELFRVRKSWLDAKSQIGAFHDIEGAKDLVNKNIEYKVYDEDGNEIYKYIAVPKDPTPPTPPTPTPKPTPVEIKNPIMGKSLATLEQMVAFVEKENQNAQNLKDIALSFLEVGEKYGIRGDVAFVQSIIETHWFKFDLGTAVTPDQHNYCGMGVTRKGMKGNSFNTVKDGVTAQIQHLMAYANTNSLPIGEILLDPRFKYVTRGIAPNWEDLSMRWAMNENYGTHILSIYKTLLDFPIPEKEVDLEEIIMWIRESFEIQKIIMDLYKNKK